MTLTNAERVANWRSQNPERALAQSRAARQRYNERKRIAKMSDADMLAELSEEA